MKPLKGVYKLKNPSKYKGNPTNVVYRSSWERILMAKWDTNDNVVEWSSEEIVIPYRSPATGKIHRYFPDFYLKIKNITGEYEKIIIEVKPQNQVDPPKPPKRITGAWRQKALLWEVNNAKWEAARKWCATYGYRFEILSEAKISRFKK